jgi:hypothetical protein
MFPHLTCRDFLHTNHDQCLEEPLAFIIGAWLPPLPNLTHRLRHFLESATFSHHIRDFCKQISTCPDNDNVAIARNPRVTCNEETTLSHDPRSNLLDLGRGATHLC